MDTLKQRLPDSQSNSVSRRSFLAAISGAAGGAWAPQVGRAAAAQDNANPVHQQAMPSVERLIDLAFTDAERDTIIDGLDDQLKVTHELHQLSLPNHLSPALQFHPELPGMTWDGEQRSYQIIPAKIT